MFKLSRYYSLASLTGILAVVVALSVFYRELAFKGLREHETRSNITLAQVLGNGLWPEFGAFITGAGQRDPSSLAQAPEIARLRTLMGAQVQGTHVVKVKIYDAGGLTIFSSDPGQIGESQADNTNLRSALAGEPVSVFTHRDAFHGFEAKLFDRQLVSSYVPLREAPGGPVLAAAEIYSDVTDLVETLSRIQRRIILGVGGAMAVLYLFLFLIVRRADRIIDRNASAIRHQADHDLLTKLPNRARFAADLQRMAAATTRGTEPPFAVLFIDLDRFKRVNDSFGHDVGDLALRLASQRLEASLRSRDQLYRMGGDEFTALLSALGGPEDAATVAARIVATMAEPVHLRGHDVHLSASVGIALCPTDHSEAEELLRLADHAMYRAKAGGRQRYAFHDPGATGRALERVALETAAYRAARDGEFEPFYQPRVDATNGAVLGMEVLLRWRHPESGLLQPEVFLPTLEETGLIVPIGARMLRSACAQAVEWEREGLGALRISVNVSPLQWTSGNLLETVRDALADSGLPADRLELEITEGALLEDTETALTTLAEVRAMGVTLALDDFGVGFSSLSYLERFPVDVVKIDKSFVNDLPHPTRNTAIAGAITDLARRLDIRVTAEGVEHEAQASYLRAQHCDEIQGYLYGRPLPAAAATELLRSARKPT